MKAVSDPSSTASVEISAAPPARVHVRPVIWTLTFAAAVAISWYGAEVHLGSLFSRDTARALGRFLSGLFPPDLSLSFLQTVAKAAGQTLATAVTATALSVALGLPLGILSSSVLWRRGILVEGETPGARFTILSAMSRVARAVLGFIRAIPDILWAILFVTMVGLGPLAGTLALAVAYSGLIGRVYADVFDSTDPQPLEALQSTGAGRTQIFLRGVWPQALPLATSYTLYSFECCVRAAAVLGLVGAGGIGYEIGISMRLFEYGQVLTLILAFIAILAVTDAASKAVRSRLHRRVVPNDRNYLETVHPARSNRLIGWTAALAGIVACVYFSGFTAGVLEQRNLGAHAARFLKGMAPPEVGAHFLAGLAPLVLQTFAIAFIGTLIGMSIGAVVALPATANLMFLDRDGTGWHGPVERAARWTLFGAARLTLNFLRAIPELVWVLVCILAIGIGPFAGTMAIGLHTAGVLGKLYAEVMEEVPRRPIEALLALGARPLQVLARGIWPQAKPMLRDYTLLRWEGNLRVSTILGLVGGGGLGQAIYNNIQLGFYERVATMILLVYGLVMATDWVSDHLRASGERKPGDLAAQK